LNKVGFMNTSCLVAEYYSWFTCHVNRTRHNYKLQRKDGGPKKREMTWSHEILSYIWDCKVGVLDIIK
jgi:hypothetical protein